MTQLTPHFSLAEFLFSESAARIGKEVAPTAAQVDNITRLCTDLLEPIRSQLGRGITVTSGLRPPWLNTLIGGSATSAHMDGLAADIRVMGMDPKTFCKWVQNRGFVVDQCIQEFGQWSHLSVAKPGAIPRNQFLTAQRVEGKTVYSQGII